MNSDVQAIAGNVYDKYSTVNPIERRLMGGFRRQMAELLASLPAIASVLEVGCGEGQVASFVKRQLHPARLDGMDIDYDIVRDARARVPGATFAVADAYALPYESNGLDLVLAIEVLEHLHRPALALSEMARVTSRYLLASVPNEPLWRVLNLLRGRYVSALGNTPGHVRHWGKAAFLNLIESQFDIIGAATPLPWIMVLAQKRRSGLAHLRLERAWPQPK